MAVWTHVDNAALDEFLQHYALGRVLALKAIAEGVENSNYFLKTEGGEFILTLYEQRVDEKDLPFFLGLMNHLAGAGLSVATPVAQKEGALYGQMKGKAAALFIFLPGRWQSTPTPRHCGLFGAALAQLHLAAQTFPLTRENKMAAPFWQKMLDECNSLNEKERSKLQTEIIFLKDALTALPPMAQGIIHGDGFPDNALFDSGGAKCGNAMRISIIDFYFACNDRLALDLVISLNAWCWQDLRWHKDRARAMIDGYQQTRALNAAELEALPLLCRTAAMRFSLTRLVDWDKKQSSNAQVLPKDPAEYLALLTFHQRGVKLYD